MSHEDQGTRQININVTGVSLRDADLVLVQMPEGALPPDGYADRLIIDAIREAGGSARVLYVPPGYSLETVPEEVMHRLGWVRRGDGRCTGNTCAALDRARRAQEAAE